MAKALLSSYLCSLRCAPALLMSATCWQLTLCLAKRLQAEKTITRKSGNGTVEVPWAVVGRARSFRVFILFSRGWWRWRWCCRPWRALASENASEELMYVGLGVEHCFLIHTTTTLWLPSTGAVTIPPPTKLAVTVYSKSACGVGTATEYTCECVLPVRWSATAVIL